MATTATDILPIDEALRQVGIEPADLTDQARAAVEARIAPQIEAAISFVEGETGLVLVDRPDQWRELYRPAQADRAIRVGGAFRIREITRLDYWTPDASPSAPADASLAADAIRYEARGERPPEAVVWPPTDGWPAMHERTCPRLIVVEGLATVPPSLVQAARLYTAAQFDGFQRMDANSAAVRLCRPFHYYGGTD